MSRAYDFLHKAYNLYADGFRQMTTGRTLWTIIIIKLVIIFAVLRLLFLPDFIKTNAEEGKEADYVATEMIERGSAGTDTNDNGTD